MPAKPITKLAYINNFLPHTHSCSSVIFVINRLLNRLKKIDEISKVECAGELRRKKEVIEQVEILIVTDHVDEVFEKIYLFPSVKYIINKTEKQTTIQLKTDLPVTITAIEEQFFAPALLEKTGSSEHYEALQNIAQAKKQSSTGRLINHRPPYQIDLDKVLMGAKERYCFIEVNAQPYRLDINDIYCRKAKEFGVKGAISSDAHTIKSFDYMFLGVNQERRGWLEAKDVINTCQLPQLRKLLKR